MTEVLWQSAGSLPATPLTWTTMKYQKYLFDTLQNRDIP